MDSKLLLDLIAQGENEKIDFKRELNLESSDEKAEFIKDLISLANSTSDYGYLIIGIDNTKRQVGIKSLEEEKIQQVAHTYIYPSIAIRCYTVFLDSILIGVIEVSPTEKPHQVIRSIGRLLLNDIFIRHGSITAKASSSEIFRMRENETGLSREISQLSRAAEKHLQIGNIDQTIASYTRAIDLMPTPELLLARAQTYKKYFSPDSINDYLEVEKGALALNDLSNALILADSLEAKKKIRLERIELFSICPLEEESWNDDISWAEDNLEERDYAFVMFCAARKMNVLGRYMGDGWDSNKIIEYIDSAVALGYEDAKAYYLRASAHFANYNYGLALYDINLAVGLIRNYPKMLTDCLNLRVGIMKNMGKFAEVYDDLIQISKTTNDDFNQWILGDIPTLTDEIFQRIGLQWMFGYRKKDIGIYKSILTLLVLDDGAPKYIKLMGEDRPRKITSGFQIERKLQYIAPVLREILNKDIWDAARRGDTFEVNVSLQKSETK